MRSVRLVRSNRTTTTNEKGTAIMKLTTTTMVTVDGVMQGLGGRTRTAAADSSAADGSRRCSTTRPGRF
jgi:hypothetical protein